MLRYAAQPQRFQPLGIIFQGNERQFAELCVPIFQGIQSGVPFLGGSLRF